MQAFSSGIASGAAHEIEGVLGVAGGTAHWMGGGSPQYGFRARGCRASASKSRSSR